MAPKERTDITYFGAGPALLPTDVLETAAQALLNYNGTGLGLAEHSHRAKHATDIINQAREDLQNYLDIPKDEYEVLFMQGGGSGQFSATVFNLVGSWVLRKQKQILGDRKQLSDDELKQLRKTVEAELKLDYIVTGSWSAKAAKEAGRLLGKEHVNIVTGSTEKGYKFGDIADESTWKRSKDAAMVYYCDNETVDGVEFPEFPKSLAPGPDGDGPIVVADMSSNILSRKIPIRNFSAIFFGAQKNLGSTGVTVVVIKKSLLPQPSADVMRSLGLPLPPIVLQYAIIAEKQSLYNTLSIFE